ncbi:MAG TPA: 1,4-dihydroxy-2-naphthoate polyprenyltransferase [Polyangiaceae bacterium]|nr:1,4-dihydroxy-2-naphthoate polyprenyltransferase [Polyangiaceae bacterium]
MTALTKAAPPMQTLPNPGSLGAWFLASRPATLPVAVAPVAVGAAVATTTGAASWANVVAALFGAVMIQIGTNFANDVFDFEKGTDDEHRVGPVRAVQRGLLTPRAMRLGMIVAFGLATLAGVYLTVACGPIIVAIGLASIASGIAYTGGPYPLGYHGLGDVFVFVFFGGVATVGTVFVATGHAPAASFVASIPVGALATNVLVVNNVRDREGDARTGKRTLAVRFGRRFGLAEYAALLVVAFAAIGVTAWLVSPFALVALAAAPFGARLYARLTRAADGPAHNALLGASAKLMLATSALFALGIASGVVLR